MTQKRKGRLNRLAEKWRAFAHSMSADGFITTSGQNTLFKTVLSDGSEVSVDAPHEADGNFRSVMARHGAALRALAKRG